MGHPKTTIEDKAIPEPNSGCLIWLGAVNPNGYGNVNRRKNGKPKVTTAHRQRWIEEKGPIPDGLVVRHKCGVRCCVNLDHLELGTQEENEADKIRHGTANYYGRYAPRKGNRWVSRQR